MFSTALIGMLALFGGSRPAQEPVEKITLELRATRCDRALTEIGRLSKLKLVASPQVASEIVLISVKDMPVRPLLTKLAYVVSGQWKEEGDGFRLSADPDRRRGEGLREADEKRQSVRNELAKRVDSMSKGFEMGDDVEESATTPGAKPEKTAPPKKLTPAEQKKAADELAASRLEWQSSPENTIIMMLQGINLAEAASLEQGDRIVYSTNPTRMQRPLPGNAVALINRMLEVRNRQLRSIAAEPKATDEMEQQMGGMVPDYIKEMMARQTKPMEGPMSKANLVLQSGFLGFGVTVKMIVYDAKGNVGVSEQSSLTGTFLDQFRSRQENENNKKADKEVPIVFSEDSKAFAELSNGTMGGGSIMARVKPKERLKFMNPLAMEPLSLAVTDSLLALAKKRGKPIIASLPDTLFPSAFSGGAPSSVEKFEADSIGSKKLVEVSDPEYVLLLPGRPAENRLRRADRAALAELLGAIETKQVPSLDDLATFASKSGPPGSNPMLQTYLSLFAPTALMMGFTGEANWSMLRFYGQLPSGQRMTLANGGRLQFGQLSPDALATLVKMVYGGAALEVERPGQKPKGNDFFSRAMMSGGMGMGMDTDYRDEPTESLPGGLPPAGVIELQLSTHPFLLPVGREDERAVLGLGPEELGMIRFFKDSKAMESVGSDPFKMPDQARLGSRSTLNFTFRLATGISLIQSLQDSNVPKDARLVSFANLPDDVQKQIAAEYEKLKKSPLAAMMTMGGMVRPNAPPPR